MAWPPAMSFKKVPQYDYALIRRKLKRTGGYGWDDDLQMPDKAKVLSLLSGFGKASATKFITELDVLRKQYPNLSVPKIYYGIPALMMIQGVRLNTKSASTRVFKRLARICRDLDWLQLQFDSGQTFNHSGSKTTGAIIPNIQTTQTIAQNHLDVLKSQKRPGQRGYLGNDFTGITVLSLLTDFIVEGGMGVEEAYVTIVVLIEKLLGKSVNTQKVKGQLRNHADLAIQRVLRIKPFPEDIQQKRRKS